ncbi:MAG: hypothetical protein FJ291_04110 [Planctomycetes bacterium]|nr:hypothetical protein [Planctomycetota bacterium]
MGKTFAGVAPHGFTIRALAIGTALSIFLNIACPYVVLVMQVAGLTSDYITAGAMMLLFVLVLVVNPLLKLLFGRHALSATELLLIYTMMIVASAIPTWGLVTNMFHILTRPFYYATPENAWTEMIVPHIPRWVAPHEPEVANYFYNGLPRGESIPWQAWVMPLAWWVALMVAVYFVMICLMVLVRRQWVVHERLTFPLTHPPMELLKGNDQRLVPPLFKTLKFWVPFAIVFFIVSTRAINFRDPGFPQIELVTWQPFFRRTIWIGFFWNFAIVGVTYFINLDVAASLWLFSLLLKIETGVFNTIGFKLGGRHEWLTGSSVATAHQCFGALIVLSAAVLWRTRHHLRDVLRKAFRNARDVDDSDEVLSYRGAVFGIIGGTAFIVAWFAQAGLPWHTGLIFLFVANLVFFGITRVVAVGGIGFTSAPMLPQVFMVYCIGPQFLGPKGLTQMAFQYSWAAEYRTSVMTSSINGMKLVHGCEGNPRRVFLGMMLAVVAGMAGAIWMTLQLNYNRGGANMRQFGVPTLAYQFVEHHMKNPFEAGWVAERWGFTAIGGAAMALLVFLRHSFAWWPVHYVGFVVADSWVMGWAWWSVFLGWLAKLIIMRGGGAVAYRRYMPIFLGMLFGQLICGGFWMVVDAIEGRVGDFVYIGVP